MSERAEPAESADAGRLARFLRDWGDDILSEWARRVRALPPARRLNREELIDNMPEVYEGVAELADEIAHGRAVSLPPERADEHARSRLEESYSLQEVVLEYSVLREVVLGCWRDRCAPAELGRGISIFNAALDRAVAVTIELYVDARDRTLQALDRLSAAALESADLDALLGQLVRLLLETTASADAGGVFLREGERLTVRTAVGLESAGWEGFSTRVGEGFVGGIAEQKAPRAIHLGALAIESGLPKTRLRALYGVPLLDGDELIGVVVVASASADTFSERDRRLVGALAQRSTSAIVQHRLKAAVEQRAAELAAEVERRRELEVVTSSHPDLMYLLDREHRFRWANPAMLRLWGKTLEDAVGKTFAELGYPEALVKLHGEQLDRVLEGDTVQGSNPYTAPDGRSGFYEYTFVPVRGSDGAVRAVAGTTRDVTERKRAEDEQHFLKEATAALVSSLDYGETVARLAKLAVPALADWCSVYVVADDRLEQVALEHIDREKLELARELRARYPIQLDAPRGLGRVMRTGEPELLEDLSDAALARMARDPRQLELLLRLDLGSAIIVPLEARGRRPGGMMLVRDRSRPTFTRRDVAVAMELAVRASIAMENARLYSEAQEAIRGRDNVLAVVAHDLRNPLDAVSMAAGLIAKHGKCQDAMSVKQLETIQRATGRMERLVGDLLELSNLQAGQLRIERGVHEAEALLAEVFELSEPKVKEKGLVLAREGRVEGVQLLGDRGRLLQVFTNLVDNAIKFCRPGDRITLAASAEPEVARFAVSDTGPGISPADLPHVFDPFWTDAKRHAQKGTGLGLSIAKNLVSAHHGRLWVESVLGRGTTFHFTVPVAERPKE